MFQYQKTHRYFAQIAEGFETLAENELALLGAEHIAPAHRGLHFSADAQALYRINYLSRLASRILAPLTDFTCRDRDDLYSQAKAVAWPALFNLDHTFGVLANVSGNDNLRHSKFAALCLKDGIVDQFREHFGRRPNVDKNDPDIWIHLYIEKEKAVISLDTSGGALHRRGYRKETVAAPIKETLAAAMVALSGWQGQRPLYDPMCGSGTLLFEAATAMGKVPAGYLNPAYGFFHLPDFDRRLWQQVKMQSDSQIQSVPPGLISGSDLDLKAIKAARRNCRMLPGALGKAIRLLHKPFQEIERLENHTIVCNPPYGIRLGQTAPLDGFYKELGDFLKQRCKGSEAYLFFGNREMIKRIGLKPAWKKPMRNAGLDGRVVKYELY